MYLLDGSNDNGRVFGITKWGYPSAANVVAAPMWKECGECVPSLVGGMALRAALVRPWG